VIVERGRARDLAAERDVRRNLFAAHRLAGHIIDLQLQSRGSLTRNDAQNLAALDAALARARAGIAELRGEERTVERMRTAADRLVDLHAMIRADLATGRQDRAASAINALAIPAMAAFRTVHVEFLSVEEKRLDARRAMTHASARRLIVATIAGVAANTLFVLLLGGALARSAVRRLGLVLENTRRLERGEELGPPLPPGDEISAVDAAFHRMCTTLNLQKRELRQANAEIESFAYSVSHDLRAPLRAVSGYAQMIEEDYGHQLEPQARRYLEAMRSEATRMGQLIDDLLRFSRVSRQSLNLQPVDVAAIAQACFDELRAQHRTRHIVFEIGALPRAEADPALIRVVLSNLFSNAVKYTAPRDPAIVRLTGTIEEGQCVFRVEDNGVGFDMRYASKLFAVFQRLHRDDEFEGTGVGLALVARVIERHGGRVSATAVPGAGATFTFTLPVAAEVRDAA
ncbi:MAG TPA: ATP-binding protein, partial [Thermoanaerobaculia bacterium]|nr:ATP-binding protein [Thermoanaerobaculia bacterium]